MCVLANTLLENHLPTTLPYEPSQFYEQNHLVYREGLGVIACDMKHWWGRGRGETRRLGLMKISCHEAWIVSLFERNPPTTTLKIDFHWERSLLLLFYSSYVSFFQRIEKPIIIVHVYWIIENFYLRSTNRKLMNIYLLLKQWFWKTLSLIRKRIKKRSRNIFSLPDL